MIRSHRALAAAIGIATFGVALSLPATAATKTTKKAASKSTAKGKATPTSAKTTTPAPTTARPASPTSPPAPVSTAAPAASGARNPGAGKSLLYIAGNESSGFNLATASKSNSLNGFRLQLVYDSLFLIDEKHDIVPRLAQSMTVGGDGQTWTIKLRPNVRFSDGTALDSAAVRANLEYHQNPANRSIEAVFANQVERIETPDPLTVVLNLRSKNYVYDVVYAIRLSWLVSPKALAEKTAAQLTTEPVGAGPYLLDQWVRDDKQIYKPNPNYYDKSAIIYDKVEIKTIPDRRQAMDTFYSNKDADFIYIADENSAGELQGKGYKEVNGGDTGGGIDMRMQTTRAPFDDVRFRQAMAHAINREQMNQVVYRGKALLLDKGIVETRNPLWDAETVQLAPDPAKAQRLIDAYVADKNNGRTVSFTLTAPTALRLEAEFIQQVLNTQMRNVNVSVELVDAPTATARNLAKDYQSLLFASAFVEPEVEFTSFLRTGSPTNTTNFSNPTMDTTLTQLASSKNPATRKAAFIAAQQILFDQVPFFYLRRTVFRMFYKDQIKNLDTWYQGLPIWTTVQKS